MLYIHIKFKNYRKKMNVADLAFVYLLLFLRKGNIIIIINK